MLLFIRMNIRKWFTRQNLLISIVLVALLFLTAGYFLFRRPPRVDMTPYIPATALAVIEIDNLSDLLDGLTSTRAWQELAPLLGLSSQLRQLGSGIDLMSRSGLGPDEVVIAGRAQYAVVVTGIETGTQATDEGVSLNLKPRFALLVETHASAEKTAKLANERVSIIANRMFGDGTTQESLNYEGTPLLIFHNAERNRELFAAASGSFLLIGNHDSAIKTCLDTLANRAPNLTTDEALKTNRREVESDAPIFAYVTKTGIERLTQLAPALFASRFTTDPDRIEAVANLFGHLSQQTAEGFFYSLQFSDGEVVEKYFTALRPQLAASLAQPMKAATGTGFETLSLIPNEVKDCTLFKIDEIGALPENLLKQLSPNFDVVAGVAFREFVINFRKQLGVEANETLGAALGNEMALVKVNDAEPTMMLFTVKDRNALQTAVMRYLSAGGAIVSKTQYNGIEINLSSKEDGRAAAFVGDTLILATAPQIQKCVDAQAQKNSSATNLRVKPILKSAPPQSSIIAYEADAEQTAALMLAISKLTRVTDGSSEILERKEMKDAINRLPYAASYTAFRETGIYTEGHSAAGIFKRFGG